jgi:hypothetical protein
LYSRWTFWSFFLCSFPFVQIERCSASVSRFSNQSFKEWARSLFSIYISGVSLVFVDSVFCMGLGVNCIAPHFKKTASDRHTLPRSTLARAQSYGVFSPQFLSSMPLFFCPRRHEVHASRGGIYRLLPNAPRSSAFYLKLSPVARKSPYTEGYYKS